ncbi:Uu.00g118060.m01.CDS01 [Anthostomella pinea]|uniref:Uu.00g118060.m01.CDS01 n=1 Tax=Anthostomella pinea TaxID=933095 RepID=A0AAI8YH47_9PEZI|nr:Uu.00g118060.m01.CDS01 [Anthostomella pinea]
MARPATYLAPLSLIFLAGSIVLMFFIILSGMPSSPLRQTYFLRADTSGITGARPITQWAYFYICGDGNRNCGGAKPDPPLGWAWDANPQNAPSQLVGSYGRHTTSEYYYYMWRFGWVFYLIGLFFTVLAFFAGFIACCGRLGSAIASMTALTALFFYTLAVSLMTAVFVKMRNAFVSSGRSASLGRYAFGFSWGAWAALFIATILFCIGIRGNKDKAASSGGRSWGRKKSVRSTRSYDMGSQRRVKDDYA